MPAFWCGAFQFAILDDEQVNIPALVDAGHVELLPEPSPKKGKGVKSDG